MEEVALEAFCWLLAIGSVIIALIPCKILKIFVFSVMEANKRERETERERERERDEIV